MLHLEFPEVVKGSWEQEQNLSSAIVNFTNKAKYWNRIAFGNLFTQKKRVLARITRVQKALANGPNHFLIQLEKKLIEEHSLIKQQEEEFWALKSHLNWATFGDCNTFFFMYPQ